MANPQECAHCKEIKTRHTGSASLFIPKYKLENLPEEEFLKYVNALLNTPGGGIVVVHTDDIRYSDDFNKKVSDDMVGLIPDDSEYTQWYEPHGEENETHYVLRVKPRGENDGLSTLNFNCVESRDDGFYPLPQHRLPPLVRRFSSSPQRRKKKTVQTASKKETDCPDCLEPSRPEPTFIKGREVQVNGSVFKENAYTQAKDVQRDNVSQVQGDQPDGPSYQFDPKPFPFSGAFWKDCKVRKCISGMSRVDGGGSVFLGVHEESGGSPAPKIYLCFGFVDMQQDVLQRLGQRIVNNVCNDMFWLGREPPDQPVQVIAYKPRNAEEHERVVELRIKYYHGICFYQNHPPESYHVLQDGTEPTKVKLEDWVEGNGGDAAQLTKRIPQMTADVKEINH